MKAPQSVVGTDLTIMSIAYLPAARFILVQVLCLTFLVFSAVPTQTQVVFDQVEYVPNGSFEQLSRTEEGLGNLWTYRYVQYALFWRQFNAALIINDPEAMPLAADQVYGTGLPYDPVSCSTPDLHSYHLTSCGPNVFPYSMFDIPWNYFGYELYRGWSPQTIEPRGRYAGLYYRLNAIRRDPVTAQLYVPATGVDPAAEYWREYVEVELLCPLEAGHTYHVSYWVSLGEWSTRTIRLEARLSQAPYTTTARNICNPRYIDGDNELSHVAIPTTAGGGGHKCVLT